MNTIKDLTALLFAATEHVKLGEYAQAQAQLKSLLEIDPQHEIAIGMLAAIYAELKEPEHAVMYFQTVLNLNPENVLARFQLALIQLELKQPLAALETWQPGKFGPNQYLVNFYSGVALLQLDRPREALLQFQLAQQGMPTNHVLYPDLVASLIKLSN